MNQQKSLDMLRHLAADVNQIRQSVSAFGALSANQITRQPAPDQWSIAQCLEHLNTYSRYYLPRVEAAISRAEAQLTAPAPLFSSSWLGAYFVDMMQPSPTGKSTKRYKAARRHQPANDLDPHRVQTEFQQHQLQLINLLQRAEPVNLRKLTIPLSIAGWLSLNLGDVFRFLVVHEQRHVAQAHRVQLSLTTVLLTDQ